MQEKYHPKFILGYSDMQTVKIDFDHTPYQTVKYWAIRAMNWFKLQGFIIFKSSKHNYHIIFCRRVSWRQNMHIVAWVALESHTQELATWFIMQCIKESSTLRISPKGRKSSPKIVHRYGRQDRQIQSFLQYRKKIKKIFRELSSTNEEETKI